MYSNNEIKKINAKDDLVWFVDNIGNEVKIKCAEIYFDGKCISLKENYLQVDELRFYLELNFVYDNTVKYPFVSGVVWLEDDSWLSRDQASYGWDLFACPEIPKFLKNGKNKNEYRF